MSHNLPENLKKYFWDCDFSDLSTERILNYGDMASLKWLLAATDESFLKKVVEKSRNLDKKTGNYWKIMLYDNEPAY